MEQASNDIAVIGIGCRFPGAESAEQFYDNLISNKDCIDEIPESRWAYDELFSNNGGKGRISSKWGGFISGVDEFDARFFKIIPSEAEQLDPQQKLFLTCSWEAMEDGGYVRRDKTYTQHVGVYCGVTWNEFSLYANEYGYLNDEYKGAGSLYWGIPNRVSYFFDFIGPSVAIDTACSSSLVAIHLAAQALRDGDCEMALAGGINLNLHPAKYLFLSGSGFLSSEGKCRGFGEGGDGYVPSEGVGVLLLKPLESAEKDGDRIYGVIKSSATNHGGKATGYTVPNPRAHHSVIKSALHKAGVLARDISYVECHGTGTDLGDPIEVTGLKSAYEEETDDRQFCGIGTVKSNIGHCEAAAGVAGLIKLLMSMRAGVIPATLHAETPNKKIDFDNSPFYLVQENQSWGNATAPVLAGLSSFGAGGSNSHCIVQSYVSTRAAPKSKTEGAYIFPISATSADRCSAYTSKLLEYITRYPDTSPADLSYSLTRRETFPFKVAFVASSLGGLSELLGDFIVEPDSSVVRLEKGLADLKQCHVLVDWASEWTQSELGGFEGIPLDVEDVELLSIPTYAFEPHRSWIHPSSYLYRKQRPVDTVLHPLIDSNVSSVTNGAFKKRLFKDEYFVEEHWVEGDPVLPGVCLAEMARFSAETYFENPNAALSDIWFLEPINLAQRSSVEINVRISAQDQTRSFEILTGSGVKHASGHISNSENITASDPGVLPEKLLSKLPYSLSREQAYIRFGESGIEQRGRFQVVSEFRYDDMQAVARLTLSPNVDDRSRFGLHPALMDGAVQTAMLHLYQRQPETRTVLPFQVGAFVRHGDLASSVYAIAKLKSLESRKYDVVLCDSSGTVLAELRDFVLKEYRTQSPSNRVLIFGPEMHARKIPEVDPSMNQVALCVLNTGTASFSSEIPDSWTLTTLGDLSQDSHLPPFRVEELPDGMARVAFLVDRVAASDLEDLYVTVERLSRHLFDIANSLARREDSTDVILCVGESSSGSEVFTRAAVAMFRCLNRELSNVRFRLLTSTEDDFLTKKFFKNLSSEFETDNGDLYVSYEGDSRQIQVLQEIVVDTNSDMVAERPSAWLISGGGGGLGMTVASHLLERGERVLLLGRSPLNDSKKERLSLYPSENWNFIQCDLTELSQAREAVATAKSWHEGSWGLMHCAGVIDDGAFLSKKWDSFRDVLAAKVKTLMHLCGELVTTDLRQVVLFSSLTVVTGNRGQTDYAFANGFLDGFSEVAKCYLPDVASVTAVNWPYWEDGGMQISSEKLSDYMQTNFSEPLPTKDGLSMLDDVSGIGVANIGLVYGKARLVELSRSQALKSMNLRRVESTQKHSDTDLQDDINGAKKSPATKQNVQAFLLEFLEKELKLGLTNDDLDVDFSDLGIDSIAQMDLINKLEQEKRFSNVPQTLFVDNANISALTDYLCQHHSHADYNLR